ncbi:MAG: hypothetical protein KAV00_01940 [Phycisphaerae bacterium]|nr:hypothetical protein [Phycisphaerae bacterium]
MGHTPGPWAVIANAELPSRMHIIHVAGGDEGEANAHLIAAAPDLLETLEWLLANDLLGCTCDSYHLYCDTCCHVCQARAAIAKAKGDAPGNDAGKKLDKVGEVR